MSVFSILRSQLYSVSNRISVTMQGEFKRKVKICVFKFVPFIYREGVSRPFDAILARNGVIGLIDRNRLTGQ